MRPSGPQGLLVVGGGPAALSAVRAYREHGGDGPVTLVSRDDRPPYERPVLSKELLRGERHDIPFLVPQDFWTDHEVDLHLGRTVEDLDPVARSAYVDDGEVLWFDSVVVATGSEPVRPSFPGADRPQVHLLRSATDAETLVAARARATRAVVVGSGFIGCEAAASLARTGCEVVLVTQEADPQVDRLGSPVARRLRQWLTDEGVVVRTSTGVVAVTDGTVETTRGPALAADLVLLATGVRPCGDVGEAADLRMSHGRVVVDASMVSSSPTVRAAGDVAHAWNDSAARHLRVEHWGDALTMGEIAGAGAAGAERRWTEPPGFWSTVGDRTLKYAAWGDGFDRAVEVEHDDGGFTVWYERDGVAVGVLTHEADEDYDEGTRLVREGRPVPAPGPSTLSVGSSGAS